MKKTGILFTVVGIVVVGAVVLIGRQGAETTSTTEYTEYTEKKSGGVRACATVDGTIQLADNADVVPPGKGSSKSVDTIELSDPVKSLLLQDGEEHNYPSLLAEINKLTYSLSETDVAALMDMLAWSNDRFPEGMRAIEINAVKNDVLDKLLRQETLPEGIGIAMAEMAADPSQDAVWRDYCVQFMAPYYERAAAEGMVFGAGSSGGLQASATEGNEVIIPPSERVVIHDALFLALDERGTTIAGTALIGLENLSRTHDEFDRTTISIKAVELSSDETASTTSRMTALRLASQISLEHGAEGMAQTADAARSLAQTGDTVLMRSAAIVTLGEVGSDDDRELLQSYLLDDDRQIAAAAQQALNEMDARANAPEVIDEPKLADTTPKPVVKQKPVLINQL